MPNTIFSLGDIFIIVLHILHCKKIMTTVLEEESANNNNSCSRRKQISLENSVISRLEKHGKFGETYSELVSNILDQIEGKEVNLGERSF